MRLTPAAEADLVGIWDETAEKWGAEKAESYLLELWTMMKNVPSPRSTISPQTSYAKATDVPLQVQK